MRKIGIKLYRNTDINKALIDVARAIRQGYGAGTICNPFKKNDYNEEDFLGHWTSIPNKKWQSIANESITLTFVIDAKKQVDDYEMAFLVEKFQL